MTEVYLAVRQLVVSPTPAAADAAASASPAPPGAEPPSALPPPPPNGGPAPDSNPSTAAAVAARRAPPGMGPGGSSSLELEPEVAEAQAGAAPLPGYLLFMAMMRQVGAGGEGANGWGGMGGSRGEGPGVRHLSLQVERQVRGQGWKFAACLPACLVLMAVMMRQVDRGAAHIYGGAVAGSPPRRTRLSSSFEVPPATIPSPPFQERLPAARDDDAMRLYVTSLELHVVAAVKVGGLVECGACGRAVGAPRGAPMWLCPCPCPCPPSSPLLPAPRFPLPLHRGV